MFIVLNCPRICLWGLVLHYFRGAVVFETCFLCSEYSGSGWFLILLAIHRNVFHLIVLIDDQVAFASVINTSTSLFKRGMSRISYDILYASNLLVFIH